MNATRRRWLAAAAGSLAALGPAGRALAQTSRPAGSQIRMGFIATTDLGPVVMADKLGL